MLTLLTSVSAILPDHVLDDATVVIEGERIVDVVAGARSGAAGDRVIDCRGGYLAPGFVDVHVHGVEGADALDAADGVRVMASRLPRYGVTAFCPTSIACAPKALSSLLSAVTALRSENAPDRARVLPAHLESNFINPDYRGAQPLDCIRAPHATPDGDFSGREILDVIAAAPSSVGIVTVAPEIEGVPTLIRDLVSKGIRVSIGHSGGSYEDGIAAADAGARHATHLFNRMPPLNHRKPGLTAAVLDRPDLEAEIVCDGVHVHPAMIRIALAAKGRAAMMAITDGTAGSGLPRGSRTTIGGRPITVGDAAYLDDGTLAGSVLTMDRAFRFLVEGTGASLVTAATLCSTTPSRALGLTGCGTIAPGGVADLVLLDRSFAVAATYRGGRCIWSQQGCDEKGTAAHAEPSTGS